jgi:hypothetical protein
MEEAAMRFVLGLMLTFGLGLAAALPAGAAPLRPGVQAAGAGDLVQLVRRRVVCRDVCNFFGCREICFRRSDPRASSRYYYEDDDDDDYYPYRRGWRRCPPGYTIQHGRCEPYRGH